MGMLKLRFHEAYNIPVYAPANTDLVGGRLVTVSAPAASVQAPPTVRETALGDDALGALEYDINDSVPHGRRGSVATRGQMRLIANGAITAGNEVHPHDQGRVSQFLAAGAVAAGSPASGKAFGIALTSAAAAGDEVLVQVY